MKDKTITMTRPKEAVETNDGITRLIAPIGLVLGAVFGMAGTFVSSVTVRGLLWGVDGIALIVATALLAIRYFRQGNDLAAAGFLVFALGETLILAVGSNNDATPIFAAGAGLWASSLALISASSVMPPWLRLVGNIAALLFTVVAVGAFMRHALTPLSRPLPFFAYPFLAASLFGWAWVHYESTT
jgi:hypothetical protein